ncbi:MAG: SpoIIE family protein phosphatase [Clostridiales bacterium]|jgi:hypothetical protein|nr:SpoIIE family protein phosphatase [Clostridiales bacterium]
MFAINPVIKRSALCVGVFFLSRIVIFGELAPFGLIVFFLLHKDKPLPILVRISLSACVLLGIFTCGLPFFGLKYALAMLLFVALCKNTPPALYTLVAVLSLALSGTFFIAAAGFTLYDSLLLPLECVFSGSLMMFCKSIPRLTARIWNGDEPQVSTSFDTVLDSASGKACKPCKNSSICWSKNFNSTYDALAKLLPVLRKYGAVSAKDFPTHFAEKCRGISKLQTEINLAADGVFEHEAATPVTRFDVNLGVCRKSAKPGEQCGDNYSFTKTSNDNKAVLTLSDGMGTGDTASRYSGAAVELMEMFLHAGLSKNSAFGLVNSVLMLGDDETFATIDVAIIDLITGQAEFIKMGANTGYIAQQNGGRTEVKTLLSSSLPAGILRVVDAESSTCHVDAGDYVIMMSDGVESPQNAWVKGFLYGTFAERTDPQSLAEAIVKNAPDTRDDMLVVVCEIVKTKCGSDISPKLKTRHYKPPRRQEGFSGL